jgi:hypothetical protein
VQSRTGYPTPANEHWFVDDLDNPYVEEQPFDWLRGYHVGGARCIGRGRATASAHGLRGEREGRRRHSLAVTTTRSRPGTTRSRLFAGHQRQREGLPQLPDGNICRRTISTASRGFQEDARREARPQLIIGRCANLTAPLTHNESPQRGTCQARNMCIRGCPYGAYFSSVSATLPRPNAPAT